jgi:hypothetical protein
MNLDSNSNASNTDTTSTNGHGKPSGPASEAEFLQRQAEEARKALSAVFEDFSKNLRDGLDPKGWAKDHPWAMVAGATVAGFAAAAAFVPSKEDQALRRLAKLERALMPKPSKRAAHDDGHDSGEDGGAKDFSKGRTGFMGAIGRQLLETIKPALMSALTAGITAKAATPDVAYQAPPPPSDPYAGGQSAAAAATPPDPSAAI